MRSVVTPSWSRMITETGDSLRLTSGTSRIAMVSVTRKTSPSTAAAATEDTMARGTVRKGSLASSARLAAASKPTSVASPMIIASISPPPTPKYCGAWAAMPCEMRLSVEPVPVMSTATIRATASTTTISSSRPTATELILATTRVEAMARMACRANATRVITRAVSSFGAIPNNGMKAWLARALDDSQDSVSASCLHCPRHPSLSTHKRGLR